MRLRRRSRSAPRHDEGGYVYVIERDVDHRIKIGSSVRPKKRVAELQTGSPDRLSLVYATYVSGDYEAVELGAHDLLDKHRGLGEWFNVPVNVAVAAINGAAYELVSGTGSSPWSGWERRAVALMLPFTLGTLLGIWQGGPLAVIVYGATLTVLLVDLFLRHSRQKFLR